MASASLGHDGWDPRNFLLPQAGSGNIQKAGRATSLYIFKNSNKT